MEGIALDESNVRPQGILTSRKYSGNAEVPQTGQVQSRPATIPAGNIETLASGTYTTKLASIPANGIPIF